MIDGVIEHLWISLAEPEHGGERIPRGDAGEALQLRAIRRRDGGVAVGVECERHVHGGDRLAIVPARARIDVKDERQRPVPLPLLCEQRLKVLVADRIHGHAHVRQLQKQLLLHVARRDLFGRRR